MWMNESEIDQALDIVGAHAPEYLPYVKYLSDWRDTINQHSDGWPYWTAGTRCAFNLINLVQTLMTALTRHRGAPLPMVKAFDKALTPIKSCATRHKLPVPVLGQGGVPSDDAIQDDMQFVAWVEETLVPDIKDSGQVGTAKDFERLIRIIRKLSR